MMFKTFMLVAACFIFADARKYDNYFWDDYRDIVLTKRGQPTTPQEKVEYMCVYDGNHGNIQTHKKFKGKVSVLTTHYRDNAKCKPNPKFKLLGGRAFKCRQIEHEIKEKVAGSTVWTLAKKITVGCKVVIPL